MHYGLNNILKLLTVFGNCNSCDLPKKKGGRRRTVIHLQEGGYWHYGIARVSIKFEIQLTGAAREQSKMELFIFPGKFT